VRRQRASAAAQHVPLDLHMTSGLHSFFLPSRQPPPPLANTKGKHLLFFCSFFYGGADVKRGGKCKSHTVAARVCRGSGSHLAAGIIGHLAAVGGDLRSAEAPSQYGTQRLRGANYHNK
jgi:hypothetical protein